MNPYLHNLLAPVGGLRRGTPEERAPLVLKAVTHLEEEDLKMPLWLASEVLDVSMMGHPVSAETLAKCIAVLGFGPPEEFHKGFFQEHIDAIIKGVPAKYAHIDFTPPQGARESASRGLELRKEHGRGGLSAKQASEHGIGSGVQRASDLKNGENMSPRTVKRMLSFFKRHEVYKKQGHHKDKSSASYISWLLWGGDAGYSWAKKVTAQMDRADEEAKK